MRKTLVSLVVMFAFALPVAAHADPVYTQPLTFTDSYYSYAGSYLAYDDFTLSSAATITGVDWFGTVQGTVPYSFTIAFFTDNAGSPGTELYAAAVGNGSPTYTGDELNGVGAIYSYTGDIGSFDAAANTQYFMLIEANSGTEFAWSTGSGGNTGAVSIGGSDVYQDDTDLAFTLNTTDVAPTPEPSSLILLGTGLAGVAGMARRRFSGRLKAN